MSIIYFLQNQVLPEAFWECNDLKKMLEFLKWKKKQSIINL